MIGTALTGAVACLLTMYGCATVTSPPQFVVLQMKANGHVPVDEGLRITVSAPGRAFVSADPADVDPSEVLYGEFVLGQHFLTSSLLPRADEYRISVYDWGFDQRVETTVQIPPGSDPVFVVVTCTMERDEEEIDFEDDDGPRDRGLAIEVEVQGKSEMTFLRKANDEVGREGRIRRGGVGCRQRREALRRPRLPIHWCANSAKTARPFVGWVKAWRTHRCPDWRGPLRQPLRGRDSAMSGPSRDDDGADAGVRVD